MLYSYFLLSILLLVNDYNTYSHTNLSVVKRRLANNNNIVIVCVPTIVHSHVAEDSVHSIKDPGPGQMAPMAKHTYGSSDHKTMAHCWRLQSKDVAILDSDSQINYRPRQRGQN